MGAEQFHTRAFGRTAPDAFRSAVAEAAHWSGHGGYTGTIAEKADFVLLEYRPAFRTLASFYRSVRAAEDALHTYGEEQVPATAARTLARLSSAQRSLAQRAAQLCEDKWGPAVCVVVRGRLATEYRNRYGLKGRRGAVFDFFGWAPS